MFYESLKKLKHSCFIKSFTFCLSEEENSVIGNFSVIPGMIWNNQSGCCHEANLWWIKFQTKHSFFLFPYFVDSVNFLFIYLFFWIQVLWVMTIRCRHRQQFRPWMGFRLVWNDWKYSWRGQKMIANHTNVEYPF